jgi:hypothetical protein
MYLNSDGQYLLNHEKKFRKIEKIIGIHLKRHSPKKKEEKIQNPIKKEN